MAKFKFSITTYNQLPCAKFIWDNVWRLPFLLRKMLEKKPQGYPVDDLEHSVAVVRIDTDLVPNWKDIFHEQQIWHWSTVKPPDKKMKALQNDEVLDDIKELLEDWMVDVNQ